MPMAGERVWDRNECKCVVEVLREGCRRQILCVVGSGAKRRRGDVNRGRRNHPHANKQRTAEN